MRFPQYGFSKPVHRALIRENPFENGYRNRDPAESRDRDVKARRFSRTIVWENHRPGRSLFFSPLLSEPHTGGRWTPGSRRPAAGRIDGRRQRPAGRGARAGAWESVTGRLQLGPCQYGWWSRNGGHGWPSNGRPSLDAGRAAGPRGAELLPLAEGEKIPKRRNRRGWARPIQGRGGRSGQCLLTGKLLGVGSAAATIGPVRSAPRRPS